MVHEPVDEGQSEASFVQNARASDSRKGACGNRRKPKSATGRLEGIVEPAIAAGADHWDWIGGFPAVYRHKYGDLLRADDFQFAGLQSNAAAILATAGVGIVNVLFTVVALWLLDRVGRRPLLLYGLVGMVVSLGTLGFAFMSPNLARALAWISLACVMLYVASFAISLGPIFWLMIAEIYPLKIRGRAMSIATVMNWGSNLLVALTFLSLLRSFGRPATFWLYALTGVLAWIFVYQLVPETKGKTLEEIEAQWREDAVSASRG